MLLPKKEDWQWVGDMVKLSHHESESETLNLCRHCCGDISRIACCGGSRMD
jgi:hypothetical protein